MARIKQLKKRQKQINNIIRTINKEVIDDCFAGRFQILQIDRLDRHAGGDDYYSSCYGIRLIDHEQPHRNIEKWYNADSLFSFRYSLFDDFNNFIVMSDFWDRWCHDQDYRNDHWYSGKQKEEAESFAIKKQLI